MNIWILHKIIMGVTVMLTVVVVIVLVAIAAVRRLFAGRRDASYHVYPKQIALLPNPNEPPARRVLITGGTGFLGGWLIDALIEAHGHAAVDITVFDLAVPAWVADPEGHPYASLPRDLQRRAGVTFVRGDVTCADHVSTVMARGFDTVFHLCSLVPSAAVTEAAMLRVNVEGARLVAMAARDANVRALVYTSSVSVLMEAGRPLVDADESAPYPSQHLSAYGTSKQQAEEFLAGLNDGAGEGDAHHLAWTILRPTAIFAENDGGLGQLALNGKARALMGSGKALVDFTHARDVASAHVLAMQHCGEGTDRVADGRIYHVSANSPVTHAELVGYGCATERTWWGHPPPILLPTWVVYVLAALNEACWAAFRWTPMPLAFARHVVAYTAETWTFSSRRAEEELGYSPFHPSTRQTIAAMVDDHRRRCRDTRS